MEADSIYITLNDTNFQREALENPLPLMVLFIADWSGGCHIISSVIENLAAEFKGQIRFARLDAEVNVRIPKAYGISALPTLIFFKNGRVVDHIVGVISEQALAARLSKLLQTE